VGDDLSDDLSHVAELDSLMILETSAADSVAND
jgi:hypothetical protein